MARPTKEWRVKKNGDSLQFFHNDDYCGSMSIKALCLLAKVHSGKGTAIDSAQPSFIKEGVDL